MKCVLGNICVFKRLIFITFMFTFVFVVQKSLLKGKKFPYFLLIVENKLSCNNCILFLSKCTD